MKHYDNSRVGNDCYIHEHWYCVNEPVKCAVKLQMVNGWSDHPLESTVYTVPVGDMPEWVTVWLEQEASE